MVNNSQIATAVVLRDLECYSLETISERILLQKKIYLAQDIGLPLGYGYSWYIHGPYSTDLTAVAFQVIPEGCEAIEGKSLKAPYAAMISRVNDLAKEIETRELNIGVVQWYELVASIAYWYNSGYETEEKIVEKLAVTKPQFTGTQVRAGYEAYINFRLEAT